MPPKKTKAKPGETIATPADPYNFALTQRPFKNPSPEYLAKKATAMKRTKTVKVLLLAEREKELAEIARINKIRKEKEREKDQETQVDQSARTSTAGEDSDMDIDDDASDGKKVAPSKENPPMTGEQSKSEDAEDVLVCYSTIEAPPSLIPQKRYCDITGLEGPYTDPQTKLRYHDKEIFSHIRTLKPSTVQAYLALRGSGQPLII